MIEALDPNTNQISIADKVAIKDSGLAHIELALNSEVYVEQMALVTVAYPVESGRSRCSVL